MAVRLISAAVGIAIGILVLFLSDTIVLNIALAAQKASSEQQLQGK